MNLKHWKVMISKNWMTTLKVTTWMTPRISTTSIPKTTSTAKMPRDAGPEKDRYGLGLGLGLAGGLSQDGIY